MHSLFFCNEEMDFTFIAKSSAWSEKGLYLVILTKLHASFLSKVGQFQLGIQTGVLSGSPAPYLALKPVYL